MLGHEAPTRVQFAQPDSSERNRRHERTNNEDGSRYNADRFAQESHCQTLDNL